MLAEKGQEQRLTERIVSPPLKDIENLRQRLTEGELIVLEYFNTHLPIGWEIYIQPHLNGLRPDFVLVHPQRGIAVYEVKDWDLNAMEYFVEKRDGRAPILKGHRGDKTFSLEKNNPVTKIDLYKDEIYTLYCPKLPSGAGFGVIASGIIFPFAKRAIVEELLQPLRDYYGHTKHSSLYPIVGQDTLLESERWSIRKFVLPFVERNDLRIDEESAQHLRHWLVEPDCAKEQRRPLMEELSKKQREIVLTRTAITGYRKVRGPAGSGKTFVLAGRAATLASEGKNVLVVTFNITLINYVLDMAVRFSQSGKTRTNIEALNFHFWCKRIAYITGHSSDYTEIWNSGLSTESILKNELAISVIEWLKDMGDEEKWDAVLVDEGQDFESPWWRALRNALKPKGEALLCADMVQNIYGIIPWTQEEMTGSGLGGRWMTLDESFRLSPALCRLAKSFVDEHLSALDNQRPEPVNGSLEFKTVLKWWQVGRQQAAEACVKALMEMVDESDPPLAYADLTCIVGSRDVGLEVVSLLSQNGIASVNTFGRGDTYLDKYYDEQRKKLAFFKGDARVKVTTLHSFKGWESKSMVVHIARANSTDSLALAYVGITRLKKDDFGCYLTVINEAEELLPHGMKWPAYHDFRQDLV